MTCAVLPLSFPLFGFPGTNLDGRITEGIPLIRRSKVPCDERVKSSVAWDREISITCVRVNSKGRNMESHFYRNTDKTRSLKRIRKLAVLSLLCFFSGFFHVRAWSNDGISDGRERNDESFFAEPVSMKPHLCEPENMAIYKTESFTRRFRSSIEEQYDNLQQNRQSPKEPSKAPVPSDIKPVKYKCLHCQHATDSDVTAHLTPPVAVEEEPVFEEPSPCKMSLFQKGVRQIKRLGERMRFQPVPTNN